MIFDVLQPSLIQYWISCGLAEQDFYCRKCNTLMLDLSQIYDLQHDADGFYRKTSSKAGKRYGFTENEANRWLVKGKILSGKTFFRHLCWDCFFKELRNTVDIDRKARKGKWYAKLAAGNNAIPAASMAPSKCVFSLLFDISDEELDNERLKYATATLKSKIMKYGVEEGTKRWNAYRKRQAYTCSKEYMMTERGMSEDEWHEFNANRASTKENFIKRYGEEDGVRRWNNYCAYEGYAGSSLLWFIDKYGIECGKQKYDEMCLKKEKLKSYSYVSQDLFKAIDEQLGDVAISSRWETKNHEYEIIVPDDISRIKSYANMISDVNVNIGINLIDVFNDKDVKIVKLRPDYMLQNHIIEFNGDFWHANPKLYKATDVLNRFNKTYDIAEDIWKRDAHRLQIFEALGFNVHIVWESDYRANAQRVIDECVAFLKS